MALSFMSNVWNSFPSLSQNRNPEIVAFQQRKRPRFNNLSFSNSYNNPNPTSFNPNSLLVQNNNSFFPHHNSILHTPTTPTNNNLSFFNSLSSPQTLFPLEELDNYSGHYFNGCSSNPDLVSDFLTDEDRILLAPLLTEPQICGFSSSVPVPQDDTNVYDHRHEDNNIIKSSDQLTKPSSSTVSPQSIAARERRRKITEKTQELGKLIPGGNKMSTAEMFQSAYKYVKFLQAQVAVLQSVGSSIQEMNQEPLQIKELQVLASPAVQQKLYSEEKCLVPKQFVDQILENRPKLRSEYSF